MISGQLLITFIQVRNLSATYHTILKTEKKARSTPNEALEPDRSQFHQFHHKPTQTLGQIVAPYEQLRLQEGPHWIWSIRRDVDQDLH